MVEENELVEEEGGLELQDFALWVQAMVALLQVLEGEGELEP